LNILGRGDAAENRPASQRSPVRHNIQALLFHFASDVLYGR
jgi:hypothetical protein